MQRSLLLSALFILALGLTGCDDDSTTGPDHRMLETRTVEDLPADPTVSTGGGRPSGTGRFVLFDLDEGEAVLRSSDAGRGDSASTEWDVGLRGLDVITNGGASGPGEGAGYIAERAFSEVTEVDTERLEADSESAMMLRDWYNYDMTTRVVTPLPGRTLVARTADGKRYAKIRIMGYYEGMPEDPTSGEASSRYYTFEYVLSGETSFE